ncbi:MAG: exopolyphosphatase, partial [Dermatophilaceae bacterium]
MTDADAATRPTGRPQDRPRVAAVDCGTNSIRLLVADVDPDGHLTDVLRRMEIVRLGHGVD